MADALVHGVPRVAPPLPGRVLFSQQWLDLAFLHWPVEPASVAPYLPPGTRPDTWHDGSTYVGLVPFRMHRAGFGPRAPMPFFGSFAEWNVRLYSVDDAGRHGVVFRSLDATRFAVVALARLFGIPYRYAAIDAARNASELTWRLHRRESPRPRSEVRLRIGSPTEPTPLEVFLTSRWGMHGCGRASGGRAYWVPTDHGPWPLREATVETLDDELVAAAGVTPVGPMLRALWTPGVRARFSWPRR